VKELLNYFYTSPFDIQDELTLKIAILAEKFAKDYSWYLDIIYQLVATAGDHVGDEIWFRIVQVVTNNEGIREYATFNVLEYLKGPNCNEKILKLGGYLLGEFGHLIVHHPHCTPMEQFVAIHSKFRVASASTRMLLLSTYLKMINVFPEIKKEVVRVFKQFLQSLDEELQQRAAEYIAICEMPSDELLQAVCDEMPPFPERPNILFTQLQQKFSGNSEAGVKPPSPIKPLFSNAANSSLEVPSKLPVVEKAKSVDLLGFDEVEPAESFQQLDNRHLLKKLQLENIGVLYEDNTLQIGLKMEFRNQNGKIAIFVGNKSDSTLNDVLCDVQPSPFVRFNMSEAISSVIPPLTQFHQLFDIECMSAITVAPILNFQFRKGNNAQPRRLTLILPITVCKFITPIQLNGSMFIERWRQMGGPPLEAQMITEETLEPVTKTLKSLNIEILDNVDPNPENVVGSGIFIGAEVGKVGSLVRLEKLESVIIYHQLKLGISH
jgi:AP-2 complex subunit alpha